MRKKIFSTLCAFSLLGVLAVPAAFAADSTDAEISKNVREAIHQGLDRPMDNNDVTVHTDNGTVYLRGKVHNQEQLTNAETIAKATPGVNKVVNQLELMSDGHK